MQVLNSLSRELDKVVNTTLSTVPGAWEQLRNVRLLLRNSTREADTVNEGSWTPLNDQMRLTLSWFYGMIKKRDVNDE